MCGSKKFSCSSLSVCLDHWIIEENSRLLVDVWIGMYESVVMEDVFVSPKLELGEIKVENEKVNEGRVDSLIVCFDSVVYEQLNFSFS
jgi:hypothetical protein